MKKVRARSAGMEGSMPVAQLGVAPLHQARSLPLHGPVSHPWGLTPPGRRCWLHT